MSSVNLDLMIIAVGDSEDEKTAQFLFNEIILRDLKVNVKYFTVKDWLSKRSELDENQPIISIGGADFNKATKFYLECCESIIKTNTFAIGINKKRNIVLVYGFEEADSTKTAVKTFINNHLGNYIQLIHSKQKKDYPKPKPKKNKVADSASNLLNSDSTSSQNSKSNTLYIKNLFGDNKNIQWKDITLEFVSDESIRLKAPGLKPKRYTFTEFGMKDNRKGDLPDRLWNTLKLFAHYNGEIPNEILKFKNRSKIEKSISDLRKLLVKIFGITGSPISRYRRSIGKYQTKFIIRDCRYGENPNDGYG